MAFQKAIKEQSKLRLAVGGLAGTGKTYTVLALAAALAALIRAARQGDGRVALIDSERGSARLYADKFDFDVDELEHFSPLAYVEKIHDAERSGYDIIIADSISHAWAGKGGALEQKDSIAARDPRGNSWTAWRDVTPKHNEFVDAMVSCRAHFMATMRQKMEYVQNVVDGKTKIERVGLQAIQREGMEYEFTLVGDMDYMHTLRVSKTRIDGVDIGAQFERPGESLARQLYSWLMSGAAPAPRPVAAPPAPVIEQLAPEAIDALHAIGLAGSLDELAGLVPRLTALPESARAEARVRYNERHALLSQQPQGAAS